MENGMKGVKTVKMIFLLKFFFKNVNFFTSMCCSVKLIAEIRWIPLMVV